jgi:hypothetical protein
MPGHVIFCAREKVKSLKHQALVLDIIVLEIRPDGAPPIEVIGGLQMSSMFAVQASP